MTYYTYKTTPMGEVLFTREGETLTGLHWKVFRRAPVPTGSWVEDEAAFADVFSQLDEYYAGKRQTFDTKVAVKGTPFQMSVWHELEKIPYGKSSSYGAIAAAIGKPAAVRAVGTAVGSNPISILIPCHRVLTSVQGIGGYAGGLPAKQALLATEGIRLSR